MYKEQNPDSNELSKTFFYKLMGIEDSEKFHLGASIKKALAAAETLELLNKEFSFISEPENIDQALVWIQIKIRLSECSNNIYEIRKMLLAFPDPVQCKIALEDLEKEISIIPEGEEDIS